MWLGKLSWLDCFFSFVFRARVVLACSYCRLFNYWGITIHKKQGLQSASIGSLFATTPLHLHVKFLYTLCHWKCSAGLCTVPSTLSFHWNYSYLSTVVWIVTSIIYLKSELGCYGTGCTFLMVLRFMKYEHIIEIGIWVQTWHDQTDVEWWKQYYSSFYCCCLED